MGISSDADYHVSFRQNKMFNSWSYVVTTPDGRKLYPLMGLFVAKEAAERDALRAIRVDRKTYEMTGAELARKYIGEQES